MPAKAAEGESGSATFAGAKTTKRTAAIVAARIVVKSV